MFITLKRNSAPLSHHSLIPLSPIRFVNICTCDGNTYFLPCLSINMRGSRFVPVCVFQPSISLYSPGFPILPQLYVFIGAPHLVLWNDHFILGFKYKTSKLVYCLKSNHCIIDRIKRSSLLTDSLPVNNDCAVIKEISLYKWNWNKSYWLNLSLVVWIMCIQFILLDLNSSFSWI